MKPPFFILEQREGKAYSGDRRRRLPFMNRLPILKGMPFAEPSDFQNRWEVESGDDGIFFIYVIRADRFAGYHCFGRTMFPNRSAVNKAFLLPELEMARKSAMWKEIFYPPTSLPLVCVVALFAMSNPGSVHATAKNPAAAEASGAIIVPPATDPGMAKEAPPSGDPQAVKPPPMPVEPDAVRKAAPKNDAGKINEKASKAPAQRKAAPATRQDSKPPPRNDDCKGPAELCRQDSAR
jgi:hypothetical protein